MGTAAPTPRTEEGRELTRLQGPPRWARSHASPPLRQSPFSRMRKLRNALGQAERRGAAGTEVRLQPHLGGRGGGAGCLESSEPNSPVETLACLEVLGCRVPGTGPVNAVPRPHGARGAPHPLGTKEGTGRGRDERDLPEFIIDCESHHPLSGP